MPISREEILAAIRGALEPLDIVHAMWEGGAAAFNRVDEWSDIDLQILCDDNDEAVDEVFRRTEAAMETLSPIELKYEIPQPSWHGHTQAFYRLADAGPFLLIDFVLIKEGNTNRFREREIHGDGPVHFDKKGVMREEHIDSEAFANKLERRLKDMRVTFDLFQAMVLKEVHRDNPVEALQYYHGMTLRPLLELARITHDPARYNFHTRYFYYDLPKEVYQRMEPLFFVKDIQDLHDKHRQAGELFYEWLDAADIESIRKKLGEVVGS